MNFSVFDNIVGGKTGYTDGALGVWMLIVKRANERRKLIAVVLGFQKVRFEADEKKFSSVDWTSLRWQ